MHQVLLIQEILDQILDELRRVDDNSAIRRNSDIVAFALTSKDILELALDKIWHDLPRLTPPRSPPWKRNTVATNS
ncbi:hypothetical protein NLI96_g172 [Meripilus lineatus]|uniref:Uncharacterized protein n=1 Tax=Meripilus lineatus TaxID=2056292 RepID=A0AAD5VCT5_9APHY|nr:hypothetical protein NLI96_g172 [Physisporinus lineatus]